ncbi:MAG: hypothetical protein ABIJ59_02200 [Pseudomonadota bacterium]
MEKGQLIVKVLSESYFLEGKIPIQIRDSRFSLVKEIHGGDSLKVDPGLYQISSVLQNGQDYKQIVQVPESGKIEITLNASQKDTQKTSDISGLDPAETIVFKPLPKIKPLKQIVTKQLFKNVGYFPSTGWGTMGTGHESIVIKHPQPVLEGARGAKVQSSKDGRWVFEPDKDINAVPRAQFKIGREFMDISLPIYPKFATELNICEVHVQPSPTGFKIRAWISPKRTVASTLQRLLTSGYLLKAAEIASEATELLQYKYDDPTGAALGALLLHKADRLMERQDWVKNLANGFKWLPDGKILLAILLSRDENKLDQAMDLAVEACSSPVLFTESYSLLVNLLREWQSKAGINNQQNESLKNKLAKALSSVAQISPYIDWEATTLTNSLPKGGISCWK